MPTECSHNELTTDLIKTDVLKLKYRIVIPVKEKISSRPISGEHGRYELPHCYSKWLTGAYR